MIFLIFLLIFIILLVPAILFRNDAAQIACIPFGFIFFLFMILVIVNLIEANSIKAQIVLMKPLEKYRQDIAINEMELAKVERLIDRAVDKNTPNVSVNMKDNVKIYSFLGSSDLGSAEAGNAKKQELLVKYIEKQNEIAEKLIYVKKMAYGDEYYKLQQQYATYCYSIFDGLIVRWFSLPEDYKPISNQKYQPND